MPTISPSRTTRLASTSVRRWAPVTETPVEFEERRAGLAGDALARRHVAADHHLGDRAAVGVGGDHLADLGAGAQDGDAVGDGEHLAELVGDEDDGEAAGGERRAW